MVRRTLVALAFLAALSTVAAAGSIPLVDPTGARHGSVALTLVRGQVKLKAVGLAPRSRLARAASRLAWRALCYRMTRLARVAA